MSDVTISYKGNAVAAMDASGTKTLLTRGQYCEDNLEVAYVKPSGGSLQKATGSFTLVDAANNSPIITHNLGTTKIAVIIYPVSVAATAGYRFFYAAYINVPELIESGSWSLDFTSYNSTKFPAVVSVDPKNPTDAANIRDVSKQSSPWTTQNNWWDANNESTLNSNAVLTSNTIRLYPSGRWADGSYKYIVFALE